MQISSESLPPTRFGKKKLRSSRRNEGCTQKWLSAYSQILALASDSTDQPKKISRENLRSYAINSKTNSRSESNSSSSAAGNFNPHLLINSNDRRAESVQSIKNHLNINLPARQSKITKSALRVVRDASNYVKKTLKALALRDTKTANLKQLRLRPISRKGREEEHNERNIALKGFSSHEKKGKGGPGNDGGEASIKGNVKDPPASSASKAVVSQNSCTSRTKKDDVDRGIKESRIRNRRGFSKPVRRCNFRRRDGSDAKRKTCDQNVTNGMTLEKSVTEEKSAIQGGGTTKANVAPSTTRKKGAELSKSARLKIPFKDGKGSRKSKFEDHKSDMKTDWTNRTSSPLVLPQSFNPSATQASSRHLFASGHDGPAPNVDGDKAFEEALAIIISRTSKPNCNKLCKKEEKALHIMSTSQMQSCQWGQIYDSLSKQAPGNSMKECMNKFYSRQSTPVRSTQVDGQQDKIYKNQPTAPSLPQFTTTSSSRTSRNGPSRPQASKKFQEKLSNRDHCMRPTQVPQDASRSRSDTNRSTTPNENGIDERGKFGEEDAGEREGSGIAAAGESCTLKDGRNERLDGPSDKENRQPLGINMTASDEGVAQRILPMKEVTLHLDNLPGKDPGHVISCTTVSTRPRIMSSICRRKPCTNLIYLHSKDALDFDDDTLNSTKLAKDAELAKVKFTDGNVNRTNSLGIENVTET